MHGTEQPWVPQVIFGLDAAFVATFILVVTYAVIMTERLNRALVAPLGACLGGNGTLIGASANLTVAGLAERAGYPIRFVPFMKVAFPMMLISIAISTVYVYWRFL